MESDKKPEPGDISLCFYCATVMTYDEDSNLKISNEKDLKELDEETLKILSKVQDQIRANNEK